MLPRRQSSQNRRVPARLIPPRQLMILHPRSRLRLGLRVMLWSLPLHLLVVGLNPRRRLHLSLRANLLLLPLHRASTTWHLPRLWIHQRCPAGQKSARGNSCAAESPAQYVSRRAAGYASEVPNDSHFIASDVYHRCKACYRATRLKANEAPTSTQTTGDTAQDNHDSWYHTSDTTGSVAAVALVVLRSLGMGRVAGPVALALIASWMQPRLAALHFERLAPP